MAETERTATHIASRQRLKQAVVVALSIAGVLGLSHLLGIGLPLLYLALAVIFAVARFAPHIGVRWLDEAILAVRAWLWAKESGRHHSFAGQSLDIEEHAGQMWLSVDSFQRALRQNEPESVTAARLARARDGVATATTRDTRADSEIREAPPSRRNDDGVLMLNVQDVVHHLTLKPGRMDPRVLRLRQYLERQVLFPAAQRRRRAQGADSAVDGSPRPNPFADSNPRRDG